MCDTLDLTDCPEALAVRAFVAENPQLEADFMRDLEAPDTEARLSEYVRNECALFLETLKAHVTATA
jgi:hypothetical protein